MKKWENKQVIKQIKEGKVFIFPTDTVYGIGCSIDSVEAINNVYQIKGRKETNPVPVLVTRKQVLNLARTEKLEKMAIEQFWPGNLTLILGAKEPGELDERLIADGKIALRQPDFQPLLELIAECGPLVGTSANISGEPAPTAEDEISGFLLREVNFILGGKEGSGAPSTVAELNEESGNWKIHREGEIDLAELPEK